MSHCVQKLVHLLLFYYVEFLEITTGKYIYFFYSNNALFLFCFQDPSELYSILQSLHPLFYPFSERIVYCCATKPEKTALQTNVKDTGSPVHSYDRAK